MPYLLIPYVFRATDKAAQFLAGMLMLPAIELAVDPDKVQLVLQEHPVDQQELLLQSQ